MFAGAGWPTPKFWPYASATVVRVRQVELRGSPPGRPAELPDAIADSSDWIELAELSCRVSGSHLCSLDRDQRRDTKPFAAFGPVEIMPTGLRMPCSQAGLYWPG